MGGVGGSIPLKKVGPVQRPHVELLDDELRFYSRRYFTKPLVVDRGDVLAAVDLATTTMVPPEDLPVLAREPEILDLHTGATFTAPVLALLFRSPQRVPAIRHLYLFGGGPNGLSWRRSRSRAGQVFDGILISPTDPRTALRALVGWGVPTTEEPWSVLTQVNEVIHDPELAAEVAGQRRQQLFAELRRFRRYNVLFLALLFARPLLDDGTPIPEIVGRLALTLAFGTAFAWVLGQVRSQRWKSWDQGDRAAGRRLLARNLAHWAIGGGLMFLGMLVSHGLAHVLAQAAFYGWVGAGLFVVQTHAGLLEEP